MRVRWTLLVGLGLGALALCVTLARSPPRLVGSNRVPLQSAVAVLRGGEHGCLPAGTIPGGTSAIRMHMESVIGPAVTVLVLGEGHVVSRGTVGSGWTGADVTVPIQQLTQPIPRARVCLTLGVDREAIIMLGTRSPPSMRIEYLSTGGHSWWSRGLSVARRMGLGRAPSGTWAAVLLASLMAAVAALTSYTCLRELGRRPRDSRPQQSTRASMSAPRRALRRVPTAAMICALIACLNGVCWSLVSPPFQTPDEPDHFAYAQQLAETQRLPTGSAEEYSPEENVALEDLHQREIRFSPGEGTISSKLQERRLEHDLSRPLVRRSRRGNAGVAAAEPPLYYALATIPYDLGSGGSLLDRLELMRILSALFAGVTALFAYLFVREALPGAPWAWTVGGLGVALAPLLGFMSGAVNPDAMLAAISAVVFYLLSRAFRRGLTRRVALAVGLAAACGLLTKLNFLGLVPGLTVALLLLTWRQWRRSGRAALGSLAIVIIIAASPAVFYLAFKPLTHHTSLSFISGAGADVTGPGSLMHKLAYVWQLYLPRLPAMRDFFPGVSTWRQLWFNGLVGMYGWADTMFPSWFDEAALIPAGLATPLLARALFLRRVNVRERLGELLVYAIMAVGILGLVGAASYISDVLEHEGPYWEPRYFLPLLPLLGAGLALAARGTGRRWGPAVGVLIVLLILGHDVFSQLLVVSRYYA